MSEEQQITFMQTRLIRLASEKWHCTIPSVVSIFETGKIFEYIRLCFGIFHCEGDPAVLEDIEDLLARKEIQIHAELNNDPTTSPVQINTLRIDLPKETVDYTINLLTALTVHEIAERKNRPPEDVLPEFLLSKTGKALLDADTRLWWFGPSYLADLYFEEAK